MHHDHTQNIVKSADIFIVISNLMKFTTILNTLCTQSKSSGRRQSLIYQMVHAYHQIFNSHKNSFTSLDLKKKMCNTIRTDIKQGVYSSMTVKRNDQLKNINPFGNMKILHCNYIKRNVWNTVVFLRRLFWFQCHQNSCS